MNAKNIISAFNNEIKSFNSAIRFVFETSKLPVEKLPAAPAKDDKSEDAKNIRKEIKRIENANGVITDCQNIVNTFAITANDIKGKAIKALRDKVMNNAPMIDVNGVAVKMVKLPSYLKNEIKEYKEVFAVVPAAWIETIIAAAENIGGKQMNGYNITIAPVIEEGEVIEGAKGDIVNAKGETIGSDKIFAVWDKEATINNIANAAGRAKTQETKAELKAK